MIKVARVCLFVIFLGVNAFAQWGDENANQASRSGNSAESNVSAKIGFLIPAGNMSKMWAKKGFSIGCSFDRILSLGTESSPSLLKGAIGSNVEIDIFGAKKYSSAYSDYYYFQTSSTKYRVMLLQIDTHGKIFYPLENTKLSLYFGGGPAVSLRLIKETFDYSYGYGGFSESDTDSKIKLGLNLMAGIELPVISSGKISLGGRCHLSKNFSFYEIAAGYIVSLGFGGGVGGDW